jgi:AraC-like DNA-binding protein
MAQGNAEKVSLHRNDGVAGVEVRVVGDSARGFSFYSTGFEFVAPSSWAGEVRHRGETVLLGPGSVLCVRPGDVFAVQRVRRPGSHASLLVEERSLAEFLDEPRAARVSRELLPQATMSTPLGASLDAVFQAFAGQASSLEIRTALAGFFCLAVPELLHPESATAKPCPRTARKIRERLEQDPAESLDLGAVAAEVGLSRFEMWRAFKRQFGVPPHVYRMSIRLGLARRSLRRGLKPADVALEYGFFDQSHLTRHFKHRFGIAPAEYVRGKRPG